MAMTETKKMASSDMPTTKRKSKGGGMALLIVLLLILAGGASAMAYSYYTELQELRANPQKAAQDEVAALVARVGKLIVLPTDEQPTVATVADPEKLKDQPFFANAKKGDRVLIYTNARKAILYDPVANKILDVAPINIGNAAPAPAPAPAPEPEAGQ